jgi:hypothetical protein
MIDREGRAQLAWAITKLIDGEITTDDFELSELGRKEDRALLEIWRYVSSFYHDLYPYRLKGKHALSARDRQQIERCILFLNSELEYRWPPYPRMVPSYLIFISGVLLGVATILFSYLGIHFIAIVSWSIATSLLLCAWICSRRIEARKAEAFWQAGEREVWPFLSRVEYEQAMSGGQGVHL